MSIKKYISEGIEKRKVIEEIQSIILDEDEKAHRRGRNEQSAPVLMKLLINIGNQAYTLGDIETFESFASSLFELMDYEIVGVESEEIFKHIRNFVLMSTHSHNIYLYSIILEKFAGSLIQTKDAELVNSYLQILRELALGSITNNFELGVLEVVNTFKTINEYFLGNRMYISSLNLKNLMVMLIYSAEKYQYDQLKAKILDETRDFLKFPTAEINHNPPQMQVTKAQVEIQPVA